LWAHARRLTGEDHAADDVLQESWIAVIGGLRGLADADTFPKWVFRIVTNKSCDWVRRQERQRRLKRAYLSETQGGEPKHPPSHDNRDLLEGALAALSANHRATVALHYFEGFGINEIAQMLHVPPGTVKSRLSEARGRIRAYVEEQDHVGRPA